MNHVCTYNDERHSSAAAARNLLSLREVVTLADVPEKRVRKDIETGILAEPRIVRLADSRLAFTWDYVVFVAAVYGNDWLTGKLRKIALTKLDKLSPVMWTPVREFPCVAADYCAHASIDIDNYISLNLDRVLHRVSPRVEVYCNGLSRTIERNDILGGEAVFRGSRLSVAHVGKMVEAGESEKNILEDYPYLNEDDVKFASLYYRAHPAVGRPRANGEAEHAEVDAR